MYKSQSLNKWAHMNADTRKFYNAFIVDGVYTE